MKIFVGVEHAFHRLRSRVYARLNRNKRYRRETLRRLDPDILWMTRVFSDHMVTFSPHEVVGKSIYRDGGFQRGLTDRVVKILEDHGQIGGPTVLEIGANIGTQTIYLMLSGHFDRIICLEPDERNLRLLRRNLADNSLSDRATVLDVAAGDRDGEAVFHIDDINHGRGGLMPTDGTARTATVPLRRIDSLLSELRVNPSEIGFVWMDIEGAEYEALTAMEPLTTLGVPLLMEFSPSIMGAEKTDRMIEHLAARYARSIHFSQPDTIVPLSDLPRKDGDVLLLR